VNSACDCSEAPSAGARPAIAPGQRTIANRVGTYASFFAAMKQALSSLHSPALAGLRTREGDDPSIALCDAWAVVADVLTFYQERIVNEGYLATAGDRASIIELGRLTDYALRPGVAANVYLAYAMAPGAQATVDPGHRVQSIPPPGALPQTFESAEPIDADHAWNALAPRLTRPQLIAPDMDRVFVAGVTGNLKKNAPLVLLTAAAPQLRRVADVTLQSASNRTLVALQPLPAATATATAGAAPSRALAAGTAGASGAQTPFEQLVGMLGPLRRPPASHPLTTARLKRDVGATFVPAADTTPALLATLTPAIGDDLYAGLQGARVAPDPAGAVHVLRAQASPFGHNAPKKTILGDKGAIIGTEEWPLGDSVEIRIAIDASAQGRTQPAAELRIGSLHLSTTRRTPELGITVDTGSARASAALAMPSSAVTVPLGNWSVDITPNLDTRKPSIEFQFGPAPITRNILVTVLDRGEAIAVSIDQSTAAIQVAHGESTTQSTPGADAFVTFGDSIVITDQRALAADPKVIQLDAMYDEIVPGSWVAIERPDGPLPLVVTQVSTARRTSVSRYGITGRVTELTLADPWLDPAKDLSLGAVRGAAISVQGEPLALAEEPIDADIVGSGIELGNLYQGLKSGRWLVVQGERSDIPGTSGVMGAELVMLASVTQDVAAADGSGPLSESTAAAASNPSAPVPTARPGETTHTFLGLAGALGHTYKRGTVSVFGNVTRATHGETRVETIGSGDATQAGQTFTLHIGPLTYISAPTRAGALSSLQVTVNDVTWSEVPSLAAAGAQDRVYVTSTDNAGVTSITFGDGVHGARLPTGVANVKARYRSGIGTDGNVGASELSLLVTRPSGVQSVVNPLPAAGGAGPESGEQARGNIPISLMSLDRLVSVADYAALARTFAGVAKADAVQLRASGKSVIGVTIAANAGAELPAGADLLVNLSSALQSAGSARRRLSVQQRELVLVVAAVHIIPAPGVLWDTLAAAVRAALLAAFGFERRALAQSLALSEFEAAIRAVRGVAGATVMQFDGVSGADAQTPAQLAAKLAQIAGATRPAPVIAALGGRLNPADGSFLPAQLAILSGDVPDTLILVQAGS
jgi:hypothetical protein